MTRRHSAFPIDLMSLDIRTNKRDVVLSGESDLGDGMLAAKADLVTFSPSRP